MTNKTGFKAVDFEIEAVGEEGGEVGEGADGEEPFGGTGVQSRKSRVQSVGVLNIEL